MGRVLGLLRPSHLFRDLLPCVLPCGSCRFRLVLHTLRSLGFGSRRSSRRYQRADSQPAPATERSARTHALVQVIATWISTALRLGRLCCTAHAFLGASAARCTAPFTTSTHAT